MNSSEEVVVRKFESIAKLLPSHLAIPYDCVLKASYRTDGWRSQAYGVCTMNASKEKPTETISELINKLEAIREELLRLQRSLEKLEPRPSDSLPAD